jgi:hypothetical protein
METKTEEKKQTSFIKAKTSSSDSLVFHVTSTSRHARWSRFLTRGPECSTFNSGERCNVELTTSAHPMAKLITNHISLYFNDGNIALLAPQTLDHYIAFRVHRSILSKISPVFEGLFSIPPVDEMETYEGAPLVYMMDRADALQSLLQLVYHDVYVHAVDAELLSHPLF